MVARLAFVSCLALLQCGRGAGSSTDKTRAPTTPAEPRSVSARLDVRVVLEPGAEPRLATLECGARHEATGFIRDASAACRQVTQQRQFLVDGPSADRICTMIYGGPQVATITGEIDGAAVRREVRRSDGCGISDWEKLSTLLGSPDIPPR
jgi:hypothetical protein